MCKTKKIRFVFSSFKPPVDTSNLFIADAISIS